MYTEGLHHADGVKLVELLGLELDPEFEEESTDEEDEVQENLNVV